jgi:hypothetical protein
LAGWENFTPKLAKLSPTLSHSWDMNQCVSNHQELTIPIVNYEQQIIAYTGISEKMYKTIVKESKPAGASTSFSTPRKKRPQQKWHELVEAERHAVREIIYFISNARYGNSILW